MTAKQPERGQLERDREGPNDGSACVDCGDPAFWFPLHPESGEPDTESEERYCDECAHERELPGVNL